MSYKKYDVVITGSGLGGLVSALILAKNGKKVCVLEKNNQYGGNLQTFVRNKTIFDTGVHYIGGLDEGQNLHTYFSYLGIMEDLNLNRLDPNCFDKIHFAEDKTTYPLAQGYQNFVDQLVKYFPAEQDALYKYIEDVKQLCAKFPLYNVEIGSGYDASIFEIFLGSYLENLTKNKKLRAVLSGSSLLYAGHTKTPFYEHALIMNSYIQSAYRCVNGGSQITRLLVKQLRLFGADLFKHSEVTSYKVSPENKIESVQLKNGEQISADLFISNIDPKQTLSQVGASHFKKAYFNRINNLDDTISSFSVYIKLKPNQIPYFNRNLYYHKSVEEGLNTTSVSTSFVSKFLFTMNAVQENQEYADSLSILAYMDFESVKPWENTYNTVAKPTFRGEDYEQFKNKCAEVLLDEASNIFPNLKSSIDFYYTTSPLSFRDYIGGNKGNLYGPVKDATNPLKHFIATQSKISNLYFTGQGVNMHGILGVTIGAVATCCEILGTEFLINQIKKQASTI